MREQKLYICDVCSCRYYDKRQAIKCEARHQKKIRIIKKFYMAQETMPCKLLIKDKAGRVVAYRKEVHFLDEESTHD